MLAGLTSLSPKHIGCFPGICWSKLLRCLFNHHQNTTSKQEKGAAFPHQAHHLLNAVGWTFAICTHRLRSAPSASPLISGEALRTSNKPFLWTRLLWCKTFKQGLKLVTQEVLNFPGLPTPTELWAKHHVTGDGERFSLILTLQHRFFLTSKHTFCCGSAGFDTCPCQALEELPAMFSTSFELSFADLLLVCALLADNRHHINQKGTGSETWFVQGSSIDLFPKFCK